MYPDSSTSTTFAQSGAQPAAMPLVPRGKGGQMDTVKVAPDQFQQLIFMRCMARKEFTEDRRREEDKPQKRTRDGVLVWSVQVTGIDYRGNPQLFPVTLAAHSDPGQEFAPGDVVELDGLVFGVSPKKNGGYTTWCSADELRRASAVAPVKAVAS